MTDCVTSISVRLFSASAATPLMSEKSRMGPMRARPTKPRASARRSSGTSSDTCHSTAADCMNVPVKDRRSPAHRSRKSR